MERKSSQLFHLVAITRILEVTTGLTLTQEVKIFSQIVEREISCKGKRATCKYLKSLYAQAVQLTFGLKLEPIPFRKSSKRGLARDLSPFVRLLQGTVEQRRAALTILRQYTLIFAEPEFDVESITTPVPEERVRKIVRSFIAFTRKWIPSTDPVSKIEVVPRARSGPNGRSGLLTTTFDAVALSERPELLQSLHNLARIIDPESEGEPSSDRDTWDISSCEGIPPSELDEKLLTRGLKPWVLRLAAWTKANEPPRKCLVSRLALLSEGGCKTRTIAIADEFSQSVLRPVHKKIMGLLKGLEQDCTFDQGRAVDFLKEATLRGPVYSFDLTTATDRFPLVLQVEVVKALFGDTFGEDWGKVMSTYRDFGIRQRVKPLNRESRQALSKPIYYKQGQGMGIYSSWPVFALTHHILVQWCASEEGLCQQSTDRRWRLPFKDYRIIGDDVTISNTKVANRYRATLELLEVPISLSKSVVSEKAPYCGEIAKRLIRNGVDLSPIPADLIKQAGEQVTMLPCLIDEVSRRYGLDLTTLSRMRSLSSLFAKRKGRQRVADILLTAPLAFALWGGHPFYGALSTGGDKDLPELLESMVSTTPWALVKPEAMSDFKLVQNAVRRNFILTQYEQVFKEWDFFSQFWIFGGPVKETDDELEPLIKYLGSRRDKTGMVIPMQHPIRKSYRWVRDKLGAQFFEVVSLLETEYTDEVLPSLSLEEIGIRYCLDPSMRQFADRKKEISKIASHLTVETYKVLTGEKPYPAYQPPFDGMSLLKTSCV